MKHDTELPSDYEPSGFIYEDIHYVYDGRHLHEIAEKPAQIINYPYQVT